MAWAEQCKVAFEMTVIAKQHSKPKKVSINTVLKEVAKESGIPKSTLANWWYEAQQKKLSENGQHDTSSSNNKENNKKATAVTAGLCKKCGENSLYLDSKTKVPLGEKSKYFGLCGSCRSFAYEHIKKNEAAAENNGRLIVCPACGHNHYVLKP